MISGLFDLQIRLDRIDRNGDPLAKLDEMIDWEQFRPALETLRDKPRKSNAGAKGYDPVMMFKALILQSLYNISDAQLEYQILDRLSFSRFLGIDIGGKVPDFTTFWLFREVVSRSGADVWADSVYRSEESVCRLKALAYREHLHRKGCRHRSLSEREKLGNHTRSRVRSRVEHVFGAQAMKMGSTLLRTIGKVRSRCKIGLRNLAYNLDRYALLASPSG